MIDNPNDEYDSPWKEAVEHHFPEFMAFYFPKAYSQIDWSKEHVFLDQELQAIVQDAELGKRFVDKLVRVTLLNGQEDWVYIHIEVQGTPQAEFAERMFVYNYRLFDRYRKPIASMAVLADEQKIGDPLPLKTKRWIARLEFVSQSQNSWTTLKMSLYLNKATILSHWPHWQIYGRKKPAKKCPAALPPNGN